MKFNRILEQYVKESEALTKIMLKVDPANSINKDYRDFDAIIVRSDCASIMTSNREIIEQFSVKK